MNGPDNMPASENLDEVLAELDREEAELQAVLKAEQDKQEAKLTDLQRGFRERRRKEADRFRAATDSEYWFCVGFQTREQKDAFLKEMGWSALGDKYIDGVALAKGLVPPIDLPPAEVPFIMEKEDRKLSEISQPLS